MKFTGPSWLIGNKSLIEKLSNGESIIVGGNIYRVCPGCRHVIKTNKTFFGSLHFCEE